MSIVYLLNGGGESGTSDFQDASGKNHTISVDGGSVYSDTQQVFPPDTSVYKAAGSRIYTPDSDDFDFADSDFGFEFFAHYTTYASNGCLVSKWYRGDYTDNSFALYLPSAAVLQLALWYTDDSSAAVNVSISTGAWIHWSINRVGNTVTVYKDGAVAGTIDVTGKAIKKSTQPVSIGAFFGNNYNGAAFYFDSLVISNGAALRSEPFAPPTTRPTYITFFEYFFSFDIRSLTEQFYDFRTIPPR